MARKKAVFKRATRVEDNTFTGSLTSGIVKKHPVPDYVTPVTPGLYTATLPASVWAIIKVDGPHQWVAFYHSPAERDADLAEMDE